MRSFHPISVQGDNFERHMATMVHLSAMMVPILTSSSLHQVLRTDDGMDIVL